MLARSCVSGRVASSSSASSPRLPIASSRRPCVAVRAMASQDELKMQAAAKAVEYVKSNMVVGLGTGSTAAFAVDRIGQLMKEGKLTNIIGVPTSVRTLEQAKGLGIPLATLDEQPVIDVAIDGADEVDPNLDVVKGRGGALLREKMVELAAKQFVCIVDDSKMVKGLGGSKLAMPVEIVQVGGAGGAREGAGRARPRASSRVGRGSARAG